MNILYVASRYHTNQIPIINGWLQHNNQVMFVSQFKASSEDYSLLNPYILGYGIPFKIILKIYKMLFSKKLTRANIPTYFQAQFGMPPIKKIKQIFKKFSPDIVIVRDRCVYNAFFYYYCKKNNIPTILYNQTPFWETVYEKNDILHKLVRNALPKIRMTPVYGKQTSETVVKKNTYYVPFVILPRFSISEKEHFKNDKINILCVGKYEERKHHLQLVQVLAEIKRKELFSLTLVGECSRQKHKEYLTKIEEIITECNMEEQVKVYHSFSLDEVYEEYRKADLFILPSTGEFASVSQLEAMSCSLPVICSDTNGTADCIQQGINGYSFKDKDFEDLKQKILYIAENRQRLLEMGQASYDIILNKYNFEQYNHSIKKMISYIKEN